MKALAAALACALLAGCASGPQSTFTYAREGRRALKADFYFPRTAPPAAGYPLIMHLHGGAWIFGNRHTDLFLRDLTRDGFAFASIDYRLSGEAKFPAQIEDARKALAWIASHSKTLRINPDRIAVTGISAGGQLALLLALDETHAPCRVRAVCALYAPTDLVEIVPEQKRTRTDNPVALLLGGSVAERLALAMDASPVGHAHRNSPPVLLLHGDRDPIVPIAQSTLLHRRLRELGANSTLIVVKGKGHAFGLDTQTRPMVAGFFARNLGE